MLKKRNRSRSLQGGMSLVEIMIVLTIIAMIMGAAGFVGIAQVAAAERSFPGLFFCANYRGGISIGDCIKSADRAADQTAAFLRCA